MAIKRKIAVGLVSTTMIGGIMAPTAMAAPVNDGGDTKFVSVNTMRLAASSAGIIESLSDIDKGNSSDATLDSMRDGIVNSLESSGELLGKVDGKGSRNGNTSNKDLAEYLKKLSAALNTVYDVDNNNKTSRMSLDELEAVAEGAKSIDIGDIDDLSDEESLLVKDSSDVLNIVGNTVAPQVLKHVDGVDNSDGVDRLIDIFNSFAEAGARIDSGGKTAETAGDEKPSEGLDNINERQIANSDEVSDSSREEIEKASRNAASEQEGVAKEDKGDGEDADKSGKSDDDKPDKTDKPSKEDADKTDKTDNDKSDKEDKTSGSEKKAATKPTTQPQPREDTKPKESSDSVSSKHGKLKNIGWVADSTGVLLLSEGKGDVSTSNSDGALPTALASKGTENVSYDVLTGRSLMEGSSSGINALKNIGNNKDGYIITMGTNDVGNIATGSAYSAADRIKEVMANTGNAPVYWMSPVISKKSSSDVFTAENADKFTEELKKAAAKNDRLHVIDMKQKMKENAGKNGLPSTVDGFFAEDGMHYPGGKVSEFRSSVVSEAIGKNTK